MRHVKVLPDWREESLCLQVAPEVFFPEIGRRTYSQQATSICFACDVRAQCLQDAMDNEVSHEAYGIRGGLTAVQRNKLRRKSA